MGHRDVPRDMEEKLYRLLQNLVVCDGAHWFYVGNHGGFDHMATGCLRRLKQQFPHIQYEIVLAYLPKGASQPKEDETLFPQVLAHTPGRYNIVQRNHWMIDRADVVLTYVVHGVSCARDFEEYARKKNKQVIALPKWEG